MKSLALRTVLAHLAALALACTYVLVAKANAQTPGPWHAVGAPPSTAAQTAAFQTAAVARGAVMAGAPVGQTVAVDLGGPGGVARTLALPRGKSAVIELPVDATFASVTDPKIANIEVSSPRRYVVMGLSAGQTDAFFADAAGRAILRLNVRVDQDVTALDETLLRVLPGSTVRAEAINDSVILSGQVASNADADKAVRVAQAFVSKPDGVINMLSVAEPEQVMLKVRIVEVNRSIVKQLGVNLNALIGQIGGSQFTLANAASYAANGAFLGSASAGYSLNTTQQPELQVPCPAGTCSQVVHPGNNYYYAKDPITGLYTDKTLIANPSAATVGTTVGSNGLNQAGATLQAFEQVGLVRTLAEPNLTVVSGEAGHFLAGGEFPIATGEDALGRITVTFKQFGVGLGFTPVVLSSGRISLKISTEYSQLTNVGALTQGATTSTSTTGATTSSASYTIPGLTVRRAETVVELPSGGAMMIAGLLEQTHAEDLSSLPGLMQLPVLGALFRSRDFQQAETELVVIVTPYLVKSVRPDQIQTPADGLQVADDLSSTLMGQLNKGFNKPAPPPPGKTYQGPFGYVVE
jgi:pilus assembly protein CpaC